MSGMSSKLLGAAAGICLLASAGAVRADTVILADSSAKGAAGQDIFLAMPFPPSVALFVSGVAGLVFLARRKRRKASPLH